MARPSPTVFCEYLRRICRKCGRRFFKHKDWNVKICPDCGEPRKCGRPVVPEFSFCQDHGGPNPHIGRYGTEKDLAKFPIVRLADRVRQLQEDPRTLSNRASIEIVRSRIMELAERVDVKDAPDRMGKLLGLWEEYMDAKHAGRTTEMVVLEHKITKQFEKAREDFMIWQQMFEALDLDSKLVEREMKVVKQIHAFLTAEDAYDLVAKLLAVVTDVVDDPQKLKIIQFKFTKMIGDKTTQRDPIDIEAEDLD